MKGLFADLQLLVDSAMCLIGIQHCLGITELTNDLFRGCGVFSACSSIGSHRQKDAKNLQINWISF